MIDQNLSVGLNLPLDVWRIDSLVADPEELCLLMPNAFVPFDSGQWAEKLNPKTGAMSFFVYQGTTEIGHFAFLRPKDGEVTLGFVYLHPKVRGHGLSDKMIALAEEIAIATLGVHTMLLNTQASNFPALALYHRCGYEIYSTENKTVRMRKNIAQATDVEAPSELPPTSRPKISSV